MEKSNTNINNEPVLNIEYKISLADYIYYNELYAKEAFKDKKKKSTLVGFAELITGIAIILYVFFKKFSDAQFVVLLSSILIGLGIYSLSFYRLIFPKSLKKAATEQYEKNNYFKNNINMIFYNNRLEEKAGEFQNVYKWNNIESFAKSPKLYFITIKDKRSILIPTENLGENKDFLDQLFENLSKKYNKPFKIWQE